MSGGSAAAPAADRRPYRRGVGAVLFNKKGLVFAAERADTPGAWQFPQGGIDAGEAPAHAVLRELAEEIGTGRAAILDENPGWLSYDLPPRLSRTLWGGRFRGQKQKWFALRFEGRDSDIRLDGHPAPEFQRWRWQPLSAAPAGIVAFKRPLYETLVRRFARFAKPDPGAGA